MRTDFDCWLLLLEFESEMLVLDFDTNWNEHFELVISRRSIMLERMIVLIVILPWQRKIPKSIV